MNSSEADYLHVIKKKELLSVVRSNGGKLFTCEGLEQIVLGSLPNKDGFVNGPGSGQTIEVARPQLPRPMDTPKSLSVPSRAPRRIHLNEVIGTDQIESLCQLVDEQAYAHSTLLTVEVVPHMLTPALTHTTKQCAHAVFGVALLVADILAN